MLELVFYGNTVFAYLEAIAFVILGTLVGKILSVILHKGIKPLTEKTPTKIDTILVETIDGPLFFFIFALSTYLAFNRLVVPDQLVNIVGGIVKLFVIIIATWIATGFVDRILLHYVTPIAKKAKTGADIHLMPVVRKFAFWVIVSVSTIGAIANFGINVSSLLAGLGLGGLAFALAAEKSLSNIFAGVSILLDGTYKIKDRIRAQGQEGYVQSIGLRSTRMEAIDGQMVIIPNSMMASGVIENISKREKRRAKVTLGLTYDTTSAQLEKAKKIVLKILESHEDTVDHFVKFLGFGAYSLDIIVIYKIPRADHAKLLRVQHEVNLEILKQFNKNKLNFAFPTQTIEARKIK